MQELSLSIFNHGGRGGAVEQQAILMRSMLDAFEHKHNIHVEVETLNWHTGWARLVEMAIYGRGPDLSEVGSTWVVDLVRMNALQRFSPPEMKMIGSENDFIQANWKAGITPSSDDTPPVVWGLPWSADVRLVFYRRDYLEQAKIDPAQAFTHIEELGRTVATLKAAGFELPVSLSTLRSHMNIHQMASWIWDCGGNFMSADGKRVAIDDPRALRGMSYYFGMGPYIPASHHKISDDDLDQLFFSGEAALIFGGSWVVGDANLKGVEANVGVAPMPGGSFVGGSHLVVWKHTHKKEAALLLADFLIKHSAEYKVFPMLGLPAYLPDWSATPFMKEPYFSAFRDALKGGRSFPTSELWGLVEKRLADITPSIWEKILNSDKPDIDKILAETMIPLAKLLNLSLET
jgi:multiple sugar transport system substrate-binding protein